MASTPDTLQSCTSFPAMSLLPTSSVQQPKSVNDTSTLSKDVLVRFLKAVDYIPESRTEDSDVTYQSLITEFSMYNIEETHFKLICNASATLAEVRIVFRLCYVLLIRLGDYILIIMS